MSASYRFLFSTSISITILGLAATLTVGCTPKAEFFTSDAESVAAGSSEITYENYRDRKIVITVPPGNHNPDLSWATLNSKENMPKKTFETFGHLKTAQLKVELEARFQSALQNISADPQTMSEIRKAGELYGIDPVLILGNIVGEHVYNVPLKMKAQDLFMIKAIWAAKWSLRFTSNGVSLVDLVKEAPFSKCDPKKIEAHSEYWDCVADVWEANYRGRKIGGRSFVNNGFRFTFFNPLSSGYTYGIGQLDPVRALMVTDRVNRISKLRLVTIDNSFEIYEDIINPRTSVHYVAANIVLSLEIYKKYAGFDLTKNLGALATLYNLGREKHFASLRYRDTLKTLKEGAGVEIPVESYYGFFINEKEKVLREFMNSGV